MSTNKPGDHRTQLTCLLSPVADQALTDRSRRLGLSRAAFARQILEAALVTEGEAIVAPRGTGKAQRAIQGVPRSVWEGGQT